MTAKDIVHGILGITAAFILYALLSKISLILPLIIGVFSILVIYFAILRGEIFGSITGAVCGLIQDSFTLGVFGIFGISKTIMGYFAGFAAKRMLVIPRFRLFIFMLVLFSGELGIWIFLYSLIFAQPLNTYGNLIFLSPLVSSVIGSLLFPFFRKIYYTRYNEAE